MVGIAPNTVLAVAGGAGRGAWATVRRACAGACSVADIALCAVVIVVAAGAVVGVVWVASASILAVAGGAGGATRATVRGAGTRARAVADIVVRAVISVVASSTVVGMVGVASTTVLAVARGACRGSWAPVGCAGACSRTVADIVFRAVVTVVAPGAVVGVIGDASASILGVAWGACGAARA